MLISLGIKGRTLSLIMAISYLTILLLPIILGFCASFGLQFYLTTIFSKIMFIPTSFIIISTLPTIITLVSMPLILSIVLAIIILLLISKSPLTLINNNSCRKPIKFKTTNKFQNKFIKNLMNFRLTLGFVKSNIWKINSVLTIYFITTFVSLFLLNFIYIYDYSNSYYTLSYTDKGNRLFHADNPNISQLLDAMLKNENYDDNTTNKIFHWITNEQFNNGILNGTYKEVKDFNMTRDWYDTYISPTTIKTIANNPLLIEKIKNVSDWLYKVLMQAIPFWTKYNTYPYLTFGFKIYHPATSIQYTTFSGTWEKTSPSIESKLWLVAYKHNDFSQWIHYQGENKEQSLIDFNKENSNYVNAIFPLQLAKQLHINVGSIINCRLNNDDVGNLPWAKISVLVTGINNYNYFTKNIIVNQNLIFKSIIKNYKLYANKNINISNNNNFINDMLVTDQLPEVCRNVSLVNVDNQYDIFSKISLNGNLLYYGITNYNQQDDSTVTMVNSLTKGLKTLTIIVLIIATIIILVLINLTLQENKKDIVNLKILGYSNSHIVSLIMIPYIIGFVVFSTIEIIITYFLLQITLQILFNVTRIWLLFSFSWILIIIFFLSVFALIGVAYLLGQKQVNNSKFNDVIMEN